MERYQVTGMTCASCSSRVEKAVSAVEGVTSCSVNLLTGSMGVEGGASPDDVIAAVEKAGYGASRAEEKSPETRNREEMLADRETPALKHRLITSLGFLALLMYISMGHMMFGWPLPTFIAENPVAAGLLQLLLTICVMVINRKFFVSGFTSLLHASPNMDTLVAIGSGAAFAYSTVALFAMSDAQMRGDSAAVMSYMHDLYFESAAVILVLITVGKMLEARSKGKTTDALRGLMKLAPETAAVIRDGVEVTIPAEQVKRGDLFAVRPGESIPVDGVIIEGESAVNEASLTGESIPADKGRGDPVYAATINQSGYILCEATSVGEDTALSKIIRMVSDAAATKAPIAKVADRVSGIFVPAVMTIAVVTVIAWLLAGERIGFSLARGISVLVISCPCALGLATPVAIMVGSGVGAKQGILFKTAVSLEETGKVTVVALDKTGTITLGEPRVTDLIPADGCDERSLLKLAYSLELKSEHPLSRAVIAEAEARSLTAESVEGFAARPGGGLEAQLDGMPLCGGNASFVGETVPISESMRNLADSLAEEGKTPLYFAYNGNLAGVIAVADRMKEDSAKAIAELKKMGIRTVMLTGDNKRTAEAIGRLAGVDEVIAGVLPDGKESVICSLQKQGRVAMVGDGINDAPALTRADIGIAIGAGVDIAIDAADVVLMKSRLTDLTAAIRLSRATLRNIHQNLFWAFCYNIVGIPLAAGIFIPLFRLQLNPMFAAAAMSFSSFFVVTNALRLNLFDVHSTKHDRKIKINDKKYGKKEIQTMTKTMKIEGMMCGHCSARVKKALEALDAVECAEVDHEKGSAIVTLKCETDDLLLKKAVEDEDYKVVGIE